MIAVAAQVVFCGEGIVFKLFARPGAGSMAIEAMLAECGAAHTVEDVLRQANGSIPADFHRINPRGEVPTLILPDDTMMTESAAMMIYLGDRFPEAGLAPAPASPERARYLRWMIYLATTVYMSDLRMYYPARYSTDPSHAAAIKEKAIADMATDFEGLSEGIGQGPFILGSEFSAVDIYAAMLASWASDVKALFAKHPNIGTLYTLVAARPRIATVWARNGL